MSGKATSSQKFPVSSGKSVPGLAKLVMLLQTGIIVFLAFWVYEEYLYNQYLQDYVSGLLQGSGLLFVILGSVGIFALVGLGLYWKLILARRGLETSKRPINRKDHTPVQTRSLSLTSRRA